MNSLVGYGSSDSESEDETPPVKSNPPKDTSEPPKPHPATSSSSIFSQTPSTSHFDQKLDISDDEENYVRRKPSSSKTSAPVPAKPTASLPKPDSISQLIQKAEIVKVERESLQSKDGMISSLLPAPKQGSVHELELESLHQNKRKKKDKRKIFALNLDDYLEPEAEQKPKTKRPISSHTKCSLFSILPEPKNTTISTKSTRSVVSGKAAVFKPRTIPKQPAPRAAAPADVAEEQETGSSDYFSFSTGQKDSQEIRNIAKSIKLDKYTPVKVTAGTPDTFKVEGELRSIDSITTPTLQQYEELPSTSLPITDDHIPAEFRDLQFNSADIIDVNQEIQPTEEWALKNLNYNDAPTSSSKCPVGGQTKRKNQIGYLAWKAKEKEAELQNMWANNKMNRYQTQNRYGFR